MPEIGLPKRPSILLERRLDNNSPKGWQIYDDRGAISVKIRFRTEINNAGNIPGVKNKSFKGKSNAQIKRGNKRSEDFKIQTRVTRSQIV